MQINVLVNTMLATSQEPGAVTYLTFAFRLMYFPIGLFGLSVATAALPSLAVHAAANDRAAMRDTLSSAIRMMLMLNVPAAVGLMVLASPIVSLIFEHGRFGAAQTRRHRGGVVVVRTRAARVFLSEDRRADVLYAPRRAGSRSSPVASPWC